MEYITIDRERLTIRLSIDPPPNSFPIPTHLKKIVRFPSPIESTILHGIIYPYQHEQDDRRGIEPREYFLAEPDPWMITIGYIMWEAILQGLTWDATKRLLQAALWKLRIWGLAPYRNPFDRFVSRTLRRVGVFGLRPAQVVAESQTVSSSKTEVGFFWTEFGTDGSKLREMFLGLRRAKENLSEEEIAAISQDPPKLDERRKLSDD
jgi:hypothetical protein